MRTRTRLLLLTTVLVVVLAAVAADIYYSCARYGSWTWMFTPPPHIGSTDYDRLDVPEGSQEYKNLIDKYGPPHSTGRQWPLLYTIEASAGRCDSMPWVLYVKSFDGTTYPYVLNSGCA